MNRLDALDYYTLLGVDHHAGIDEVRAAFHRFALRYHPDNQVRDSPQHRKATRIFRRGTEAYRILLDVDLRALYDEGLARGELRLAAGTEQRRNSRIERPLGRRAQELVASADAARARGDLPTALLNLRIAMQREPDSELLKTKMEELEALL